MKTAEERADEAIEEMNKINMTNFDRDMRLLIINALKNQDKITRHACAEAINKIDGDLYEAKLVEASNACMNVKAT